MERFLVGLYGKEVVRAQFLNDQSRRLLMSMQGVQHDHFAAEVLPLIDLFQKGARRRDFIGLVRGAFGTQPPTAFGSDRTHQLAALEMAQGFAIHGNQAVLHRPQPAVTAAKTALKEARRLYVEDQAEQKGAQTNGTSPQPGPGEDRLEQALTILKKVAPLDREILRYQSFLAFHFDDQQELIDRAFAIERALDPTWVLGPLRQADAWSRFDPQRSAVLWKEAKARAERLNRLRPGSPRSRERTLRAIRDSVRGKPELEKLLPDPK